MHVVRIDLLNYGPYHGEHRLVLGPGAYSISARHEAARERSNWSGKTWLANAIRHALYGERASPSEFEDGWITHGAPEGAVCLVLADGRDEVVVERTRQRGTSTRLTVTRSDGTQAVVPGAKGAAAQQAVDDLVGLGSKDFDATCYLGQKMMSRFVEATSSEAMGVVSGWLRLERLQACADSVTKTLADSAAKSGVMRARMSGLMEERRSMLEAVCVAVGPGDGEALDAQVAGCVAEVERLDGALGRLEDLAQQRSEWVRRRAEGERFQTTVEEGKRLKEQSRPVNDLEAHHKQVRADVALANAKMRDANRDLRGALALTRGEFDGRCPVAGIECPAREQINGMNAEAVAKHKVASQAAAAADAELTQLTESEGKVHRDLLAAVRTDEALAEVRRRAHEQREHGRWARENATRFEALEVDSVALARRDLVDAKARLQHLRLAQQRLVKIDAEHKKIAVDSVCLDEEADVLRAAAHLFGPRGAQRRVAEAALGVVESEACGALAAAGVDLSLAVRWHRETKDLSPSCDACGYAYGTSQRAKACPRCAEARAPKIVQRLEVVPSDRSGAADDLAGIAFQLAGGAWLRRDRACRWGTVVLDEPFAALDRANRRSLSAMLGRLVGSNGLCEQMFVISHTPDAGAFAGRIEVLVRADGSRAISVS